MIRLIARASDNVAELTGEGLEYLLDQEGNIIAMFSEGNFVSNRTVDIPEGETAIAA